MSIGEALLQPTKIYVRSVSEVIDNIDVHGIAHITGGGFYENMPRCLQDNQGITIDKNSFEVLPIFKVLQNLSNMEDSEMYNVFNMGIGMIVIVDPKDADKTLEILHKNGEKANIIGNVTDRAGIEIL